MQSNTGDTEKVAGHSRNSKAELLQRNGDIGSPGDTMWPSLEKNVKFFKSRNV